MLKKQFVQILILILFVFQAILFSYEYIGDTLSLDESLKLALLNNREVLEAQHDIEISEYKVSEAKSLSYPQIDFTANYFRYKLESETYTVAPRFGNSLLYNQDDNFYMGRISLYQFLYAGRRHKNARQSADVNTRRAQSRYRKIKNRIVLDTTSSFLKDVLYFEKIKFLENELRTITNATKNKAINEYTSFIEENLYELIYGKKITRLYLMKTLGLDFNTITEFRGDLIAIDKMDDDIHASVARGLELRPELMQSQADEEISSLEMAIAVAEKNPVIILGASYESNQSYSDKQRFSWNKDDWSNNWSVGISLNLPIFDGGAWLSRSKQKRSNMRKTQIKRSDLVANIELEIEKAFISYEYWLNKLAALRSKTAILDDVIQLDNKYKDNMIMNDKDFQTRKESLREFFNLLDTIYQYNLAVLNLKYSMGEL